MESEWVSSSTIQGLFLYFIKQLFSGPPKDQKVNPCFKWISTWNRGYYSHLVTDFWRLWVIQLKKSLFHFSNQSLNRWETSSYSIIISEIDFINQLLSLQVTWSFDYPIVGVICSLINSWATRSSHPWHIQRINPRFILFIHL